MRDFVKTLDPDVIPTLEALLLGSGSVNVHTAARAYNDLESYVLGLFLPAPMATLGSCPSHYANPALMSKNEVLSLLHNLKHGNPTTAGPWRSALGVILQVLSGLFPLVPMSPPDPAVTGT